MQCMLHTNLGLQVVWVVRAGPYVFLMHEVDESDEELDTVVV